VCASQVARNCPLIVELHLRGCAHLTDAALVQLANNCSYLRVLDIRGCSLVSQSGMDALAMMVPSCRVHFIDNSAGKR
jgi:F-box/leucine-rich repeat protein 2/20